MTKWVAIMVIFAALIPLDALAGRPPKHSADRCENLLNPKKLQAMQNKMIRAFTKASRDRQRMATLEETAVELGISAKELRNMIGPGRVFEEYSALKRNAIAKNLNAFRNVIDTDFFTPEYDHRTLDAVKSRKRLIVTTAMAGAPVNRPFFESLLNYAAKMDAEILIYPADMITTGLDPILLETPGVRVLTNSVELSPWLNLFSVKISPKEKKPLSGLDHVGPRGQSLVVGSPKMHETIVPTLDNAQYPHALMSTGAVTDPVYNAKLQIVPNQRIVQNKSAAAATHDHVLGALVLERNNGGPNTLGIETTGTYHSRHVEFIPEKEGFADLDHFYTANTVSKIRPEALVLGDIHVGETDQNLLTSLKNQIFTLKPKYLLLHDLLNGHSISHHERNKLITMAQKADKGLLDLQKEISDVVTFLNTVLSMDSNMQVVVVPSNHNFWLHRWLNEGEFMKDHANRSIGLDLAKAFKDGEDPVEFALLNGGIEPAKKKRIIFLKTGSSFKVGPQHRLVELGQHGHAGANGAKGSLQTMLRGTDRIVYGHTHTQQRLNGAVNIGTSTELILPYSRDGFSSWVQSLAIVGENGEIQVLRFKDGEWYTDPVQREIPPEQFFMPDFPRIVFGQ